MIPHETWHGPHRTPGHGKKYLAEEIAPTHSVAAITLGCPRSSPRFPPLPGQLILRPARPPAAAARTPRGRPTTAACVPARAAAASTPYCRPHALQPPARPTAARALRGRRPRAPPRTPARPAVGRTLRGRPCVPWPPARPAATRTPRSRPHAPPRGRPCAPRPPPARPAADAAHTPRCRLRALQSAARSAAARAPLGRAPLGRPHATRPQPVRTVADGTCMPRGRPCPPRPPPARFAAAFAPRGFDRPQASRARLPPARRRRTRFDCLPCIQTMTGLRLPPLLESR
jgi:hypothetical protein